jgi:Rieske 2Fe-2S family protein
MRLSLPEGGMRYADPAGVVMVDLAKMEALLKARVAGRTLPQAFYTDQDVFDFDMEYIFKRCWLQVGFECELPKPGRYLAVTLGLWPILVVRDRAGELHAYHNSCRHRGSQICADGAGAAARLVCPYHRWTYELTGELAHAERMPADFDKGAHGLSPIHVSSVGGVIFVCLGEDAPPMEAFREAFAPLLSPHNIADAKVAFESTLYEKANWKIVMDNARECYHCPGAHPELSASFPIAASGHFDYGDDPTLEHFNARMSRLGLGVGPVEGDWWQAMRFALNEGYVSMTDDGKPAVAELMCEVGDGDIGSLRWSTEPNAFSHAFSDYLFMFSALPLGPNETLVSAKWLVHKDAVEGVDYDLDRLTHVWSRTNLQDRDLVECNQRGVNAAGYRPGPYSPDAEALALRFTDWYCAVARAQLTAMPVGQAA